MKLFATSGFSLSDEYNINALDLVSIHRPIQNCWQNEYPCSEICFHEMMFVFFVCEFSGVAQQVLLPYCAHFTSKIRMRRDMFTLNDVSKSKVWLNNMHTYKTKPSGM